jgi:hypothetical protein
VSRQTSKPSGDASTTSEEEEDGDEGRGGGTDSLNNSWPKRNKTPRKMSYPVATTARG